MRTTTDRGAIVHLAGARRLSPAVRDGTPALVPAGDLVGRCGWAPFFAAVEARGLAAAWDEGSEGEVRLVPVAGLPPPAPPGGGLEEARRFLRALRGDPPAR